MAARSPTSRALLRLMDSCARIARADGVRLDALPKQARLVLEDRVRDIPKAADASQVDEEDALQRIIAAYRPELPSKGTALLVIDVQQALLGCVF